MKKDLLLILFTVNCLIGIAAFGAYRHFSGDHDLENAANTQKLPPTSKIPKAMPSIEQTVAASQTNYDSNEAPPPLPAPKNQRISNNPPLSLTGITVEELQEISKYLAPDASIARYPISQMQERAAVATGRLDKNSGEKTVVVYVVVYNVPRSSPYGDTQLRLGILTKSDGKYIEQTSTELYGSRIAANIYDPLIVPFALRDINGDGSPEIIVTTEIGASIGAMLQAFSFDGKELKQIVNVFGHTIHVRGEGEKTTITAQSRYEKKTRTYQWNGKVFSLVE